MRVTVMELVRRPGYMKISLRDDIESLDTETSGPRQRLGWRSQNTSAFETWPNYRGYLRGISPNTGGRSMSDQLSHRDDFFHLDQEIFSSHGWWVSPAAARQTRGRGTLNQRGTNTYQRGGRANQCGTTTNQRWIYANQRDRGTNANQSGTNVNQRGTNANQRGMNANQRGTNANQRGKNANQCGTTTNQRWIYANQRDRGTNANQSGTNVNQRGTNANQRETNANRRGTNPNQRGMNANQREMNTNQRGTTTTNERRNYANQREEDANQRGANAYQRASASQRWISNKQRGTQTSPRHVKQGGTQANQRGLQKNQGSMSIVRLPANRDGLSLNRGGESGFRGRTSSSAQGANVKRGRSSLERITPGRESGTSSQRPNPPREKPRPFKPRQPKVQKQSTRNGFPWRDSVSESALGLDEHNSARLWSPAAQSHTPMGQRGSLADRRRSPADKRGTTLSPRGSPIYQRRTPADQRGSPVGQSGYLADRRRSSAEQRGTTVDQRGSPVGQRGYLADRRRSPADKSGTTVDQRGSPEGKRGAPVSQRRMPVDQLGSRVGQRGYLADRRRSPADQRGTTVEQRGSPVGRRGSPVPQRRTPADQRRSPVKKRGPAGDQHEISQQSGLSAAKSPRGRLAESTPPKVKFEKPPETSWLKKLAARWRSKISMGKIKRKFKAEKDKSAATSKQETANDQFDTLPPELLQYDYDKAETDPKGVDPNSLMFRDGLRRIDIVIAFTQEEGGDRKLKETEAKQQRRRSIYQANLIKQGLELELEHKNLSFNGKIWFLKVHIPWATQLRMAEVIGLKLPTKKLISVSVETSSDQKKANYKKRWYVRLRQRLCKIFEMTYISPEPSFYTTSHNYRREEQFLVKDRHAEFSSSQRILLAMQILMRAKYEEGTNQVGINYLLAARTYDACFPLHEGEYYKSKQDGTYTDRQLLYLEWAQVTRWYKRQPLWLVQRYFGDKTALYYVWLGFYTRMLILPSIVGFMCFMYGVMSAKSGDNIPSEEICDANGIGNITLCPLCDKACSYRKMYEACIFAKITYLIENPATVFFTIFMCFWANSFLVLWKQEEAVFQWQWDLSGSDPDENPRPEYEASVTTTRINPVTGARELYHPPWQKFMRRVAVSTVVFMMLAISIGSVIGVITYRISMVAVIYHGSGGIIRKYARLFTIFTGAVINLIISEIIIKIFTEVTLVITNMESPRTQADFDDSVTFKMFIFEFINYYANIGYIAFFKGSFYDNPGDKEARLSPFHTIKGDICFQTGCLPELGVMLAVLMISKQMCLNIKEMAYPAILNWWRARSYRLQTLDRSKPYTAWEQDYILQDEGHMALYEEYLEMIMQYGFVTLFVAAFPLAPLCALLNNIFEIRTDAYKMVALARRPLPERVEDIGAWYGLLQFLTYLSVVSNAFVIAYTSDFIPRLVYKMGYSPTGTLDGYVNHSLSWFNTSDFQTDWGSDDSEWDPPLCAYRGYRNPPDHPNPYGVSKYYWHVFAARLCFVVVFEHLVFTLTEIIHSVIPKVPGELVRQIKREKMLEKELRYERNQNSTDVEFLKSMAEGRGVRTSKSATTGVTINWKDEGSKKEAI